MPVTPPPTVETLRNRVWQIRSSLAYCASLITTICPFGPFRTAARPVIWPRSMAVSRVISAMSSAWWGERQGT